MPKQARRASASSVGTKTSEKTKNSGDAGGKKKDQKPQQVDRKEAFGGCAALHVGLCGLEDDPRWEKRKQLTPMFY